MASTSGKDKKRTIQVSCEKGCFSFRPYGDADFRGGNGNVYVSICGKYVLKALYKTGMKRTARFVNEVSAQREIYQCCVDQNHWPVVIPVLAETTVPAVGHTCPKKAFVMPFCDSVKEAMTKFELIELLDDLSECLIVIHALGKAHRDIKKSNVLRYGNHWVFSDYGLVFDPTRNRVSAMGERVGPSYGSPPELENISNSPDINDYRPSDIYLFGKLVWQLVTGQKRYYEGEFALHDEPCRVFVQKAEENFKGLPVSLFLRLMQLSVVYEMKNRCDAGTIKQLICHAKRMLENGGGICRDLASGFYGMDLFRLTNSFLLSQKESMHKFLFGLLNRPTVFAISKEGEIIQDIRGELAFDGAYYVIHTPPRNFLFGVERIEIAKLSIDECSGCSIRVITTSTINKAKVLPDFFSPEAQLPICLEIGLYSLEIRLEASLSSTISF